MSVKNGRKIYCTMIITLFDVVLFSLYLQFSNGQECTMRNGTKGECVTLSSCPQALESVKELTAPKFCSYKVFRPMVCCSVSCEKIKEKNKNLTESFMIQDYEKASEDCLEEMYKKVPCRNMGPLFEDLDDKMACYANPYEFSPAKVIAGGINAKRNQFPHMALIGYGDDPDNADWMCGGSVISEKYILTAAHCISSPQLGEIKYAALGILDRTDRPDIWQKYEVVKIIAYPEYKPPSKYHDIALLATGVRIRYNHAVLPACLHKGSDLPSVAIATGWGALGHKKSLAEVLQMVNVNKYSDAACNKAYPVHRHLKGGYNTTTQVCYGDEEKINDTCEGDSGGPLQIHTKGSRKSKCVYTIIGVTSYGRSCGFVGSSGMYTRVAHYLPWIESHTGPLQ